MTSTNKGLTHFIDRTKLLFPGQRGGKTEFGVLKDCKVYVSVILLSNFQAYQSGQPQKVGKVCVKEGSYVVNQAAGFSRCTVEVHDHLLDNISTLQTEMSNCQSSTKASDALREVKDPTFFQQSISISLGTSLQHVADSWFVQFNNFVLLKRDHYLNHVKPAVKTGTLQKPKTANLFRSGVFPDLLLR